MAEDWATSASRFQSTPPARAATHHPAHHAAPLLVSIHAAREGGDMSNPITRHPSAKFQSTPPARAATFRKPAHRDTRKVSIHAAREGGDIWRRSSRATQFVSIHAAREGGDVPPVLAVVACKGFNPRRPRGRRRIGIDGNHPENPFQSTPPARAATLTNALSVCQ